MTLAGLLAPTEPADFFERYFERSPLHVARADGGYFAGLYGIADVEAALQLGAADVGRFTMTKDGTPIEGAELRLQRASPRMRFTGRQSSAVLDPRAIAARFERGYTLLINDAGLFSPRLQALCNRIQRETLIYAQANAYLTPPHGQGFSLHHDTHDTLVLQIEGVKQWRVYEPSVMLPIESQPLTTGQPQGEARLFDLSAGDTLYLPRGYRHECTAGNSRSLHLTLALLPVRVIELAEAALHLAATTDVELRRALPIGWHDSEDVPERLGTFIAERLREAFTGAGMRAARNLVINELFATTRTMADGAITGVARLADFNDSTRIALRDDAPYLLRAGGSDVQLIVAGKSTTIPESCVPAIRALASGPMTLAALQAMLPDAGWLLARMLVLDGLATILDP
jgi:hypothetical protein